MKTCDKLPSIITMEEYEGNWDRFLNVIYTVFKVDLVNQKIKFRGKEIGINNEKLSEKERSFWHIISKGKDDEDREPNFRRCERIVWVKPFIQLICSECLNIRLWKKNYAKSKRDRYYIWCIEVDYIVILEERLNHFQLITAFLVEYEDTRKSYRKDYEKGQISLK